MISKNNVRFTFTLPKDMAVAIDRACKSAKVSKSKFIVAIINTFMYEANEYIKACSKKGE